MARAATLRWPWRRLLLHLLLPGLPAVAAALGVRRPTLPSQCAKRRAGSGRFRHGATPRPGADPLPDPATLRMSQPDVTWRLRPPADAAAEERARWTAAAAALREDCARRGAAPPPVWVPPGFPTCRLEAWVVAGNETAPVARCGITTAPGPPAPPLLATAQDLFGAAAFPDLAACRAAAIVYMVVDPPWRGRHGLGTQALELIDRIHAARGATLTVLVADDKSRGDGDRTAGTAGRLVAWYQRHGFGVAPQLQELLGSPNGVYGTTMVRRTGTAAANRDVRLEWW